jgi:AcrR family transcriptional regulator
MSQAPRARIDIAGIRRPQIVDAAAAIIAERGLQSLSLSEIEKRAGMSRGQLTYYFKTKEEIFLAVFDRLLQRMCERQAGPHGDPSAWLPGWDTMVRSILEAILAQPAPHPEFHCLQFTFLSQIGHRADFRERLARLYEEWRSHMARQLTDDLRRRPPTRPVSARALATMIQAMFHGLAVQAAADPESFDHAEMVKLCLELVSRYVWGEPSANGVRHGKGKNGTGVTATGVTANSATANSATANSATAKSRRPIVRS